MKPKVFFKTFGCRTNQFDTQTMIANLSDYEVTLDEQKSDVIVVNSCTVTNGADIGVRQYISQIKKKYPQKRFFLTGCGAISKGASLFEQKALDGVFGHSYKKQVNAMLNKKERFFEKGDLEHIDDSVVSEYVGKSRAFIKIQEGCNFRCSYCIIPFVRGNARSLDEENVIKQITMLSANGYGEFILTGTNVGSFGQDQKSSIAQLIKKISNIKGVKRIRLGSIEPIQIDAEFKELLDEPFMAKHLHIAIQHADNEMLKIMNRRNRFESDLELFSEIAQRGYAIGTDFILGHPGETQDRWESAVSNIKKLPLTHIHPFTYSKRDDTPSATMKEQVNGKVAKERLHQLKKLITQNNISFRENIQQQKEPLSVLIESHKDGIYQGLDQYFNKVKIESDKDLEHNWVKIQDYQIQEYHSVAQF